MGRVYTGEGTEAWWRCVMGWGSGALEYFPDFFHFFSGEISEITWVANDRNGDFTTADLIARVFLCIIWTF